jgi:hypothetical protein
MIIWNLKPFLEAHNIPPYRLAAQMGKSAPNVYRLLAGSGPKNFNAETLSETIEALVALTGQQVSIADLLEYRPGLVGDNVEQAVGRFTPSLPVAKNTGKLGSEMISEERR